MRTQNGTQLIFELLDDSCLLNLQDNPVRIAGAHLVLRAVDDQFQPV